MPAFAGFLFVKYMSVVIWLQMIFMLVCGGVANMIPPMVRGINILNYPIDFGLKINNKFVLGASKTWRGLFFGVIGAAIVGGVLGLMEIFLRHKQIIQQFTGWQIWIFAYYGYLGIIFGLGALGGDLVKSFVKRRVGIDSGVTWFPFDQIDWVVGILIVSSFIGQSSWYYLILLPVGLILHLIIKFIGYNIRTDTKPI